MSLSHTPINDATLTDADLLLEMLDQAHRMIVNFAHKYGFDIDDLQQEAALVMLETLPKMPAIAHPLPYLQRAIHNHLYSLLRDRGQVSLSLDVPIADDMTETFADELMQLDLVVDEAAEDAHQHALYTAMRTLDLDSQVYLREVYALNAYNPVPPYWPYRATRSNLRKNVGRRALRGLRKNDALRQAVCG